MKFPLSDEIKINIKEYVKHSVYHPDSLISLIRLGFDSTENKPKWEGKTVGEENRVFKQLSPEGVSLWSCHLFWFFSFFLSFRNLDIPIFITY